MPVPQDRSGRLHSELAEVTSTFLPSCHTHRRKQQCYMKASLWIYVSCEKLHALATFILYETAGPTPYPAISACRRHVGPLAIITCNCSITLLSITSLSSLALQSQTLLSVNMCENGGNQRGIQIPTLYQKKHKLFTWAG